MKNNLEELILELKQEGAGNLEAEELALLSKNLSNSMNLERSFDTKIKFLKQKEKKSRTLFMFKSPLIATFIAVLLFVGFSTLVSAQDSLPGQPLYTIKRVSENIAGLINPSLKGQILIRRSDEIKKLSNPDNKNSKDLINTINEYESELNNKAKIDIKEIEESRVNLENAKRSATDGNVSKIDNVLKQTEERQNADYKQNESHNSSPSPVPTSTKSRSEIESSKD